MAVIDFVILVKCKVGEDVCETKFAIYVVIGYVSQNSKYREWEMFKKGN